ncbi:hypothetical protein SCH4B_1084 [Ruegeria sp. TrichCH4B]|nr:hypothetical protein SCH4B_1084 [Ruegeria sp. TrichCH4B]
MHGPEAQVIKGYRHRSFDVPLMPVPRHQYRKNQKCEGSPSGCRF